MTTTDLARAINDEMNRVTVAEFDLDEFFIDLGVTQGDGEEATEKLYRGFCRKAYADGVVTDEEKVILGRLAKALQIKRARRAVEKALKEDTYRRALADANADGVITFDEADALKALRKSLGVRSKELTALSKANEIRLPPFLFSKVAGVSYGNGDGASRQDIIRKHCREGIELHPRREPENPYDENAIGLWVATKGWLTKGTAQVGFVSRDLSEDLAPHLDRGKPLGVRITEVTGGYGEKRYFGVNIEIATGAG